MSKYQSLSGRIRVLQTAPESPKEGEEYFNSITGVRYRFNGTRWMGVKYTTTSTSSSTTTSTSTSSSTTTTSTSMTTTSTSSSTSTSTTTSTTT